MSLPIETITTTRSDGERRDYLVTKLPADTGLETSAKLTALLSGPLGVVLGPALGLGATTVEGAPAASGLDARLTPEQLGAALAMLGVSLRDPALMEIVRTVLANLERLSVERSEKVRRPVEWTSEFAGEYGALLTVIVGALRFNFRSFFSTGPASALGSVGQLLGASIRQRAATGASPTSQGAGVRTSSPT